MVARWERSWGNGCEKGEGISKYKFPAMKTVTGIKHSLGDIVKNGIWCQMGTRLTGTITV